jgi:MFS family permease
MPSPIVAWYGVAVLFAVQIFSFVDRQALSLLIAPIKADLGMSDTEVSLVIGLGFALAYAVAGLPIGRLVDRISRPALLSAGLALWCGCTFLCGFVRSFPQLALARSGVGIGEATGTPVVVSPLGDWFPPHRRGLAFAVFAVSAYVGTGLALVAGSAIVHAFEGVSVVDVPLVGPLRTWQFVFLLIGPPGLLVIPFVLSLFEPRRSAGAAGRTTAASDAPRRRAAGRICGYPLGEQLQASGHVLVLDSDPAEGGWDPRGVRHVMRLTEPPFWSFTLGRRPLQGSRSQFDGRGGHAFSIEGLDAFGAQKPAGLNAGRRRRRSAQALRGPRIRDTEYIKIVPERGSDGTTECQRRRAGG